MLKTESIDRTDIASSAFIYLKEMLSFGKI